MVLATKPTASLDLLTSHHWVRFSPQPLDARRALESEAWRMIAQRDLRGVEHLMRAAYMRVHRAVLTTAERMPEPDGYRAAWAVSMTWKHPDLQPMLVAYTRQAVEVPLPDDWHVEPGAIYPLPGAPTPESRRRYRILKGLPDA